MACRLTARLAIVTFSGALAGTAAAQLNDADVNALIRQGVQQFERSEFDAARASFESVLAERPDHVVAIYELAYTHFRRGDAERGLALIDEAIARDLPVTAEFYALSASELDNLGRQDEAVQRFEQGVAAFPENHNLQLNFGITQLRVGNAVAAEATFERTIRLQPRHPSAHYFLGQVYLSKNQPAAAVLALGTALGFDNQPQRIASTANTIKAVMERTISLLDDGTPAVAMPLDYFVPPMTFGKFGSAVGKNYAAALALQRKTDGDQSYEPYAIAFGLLVTEFAKAGIDPASHFVADHYFGFYEPMSAAGHVDTFAHLIFAPLNREAATAWMQANGDSLEAFRAWTRSR